METKSIGILLLTIISLGLGFPASAQSEKPEEVDSLVDPRGSYGLARVRYLSDAVFLGRKDSVRAPYLSPQLGYYHRSGFFASSSLSYLLTGNQGRVDLILVSLGYGFLKNAWSAGVSGTQYLFNDQSYTVKSVLSTDISTYLGYDLYFLEVYVQGSMYWSAHDRPDFILGTEVSRTFYAIHHHLLITPSVYLNTGTQHYYEAYYRDVWQKRRYQQKGKGHSPTTSPLPMLEIAEASDFRLLDIEFSLPVSYSFQKFRFSYTPTLALPRGRTTVIGDQEIFQEERKPVFYWSIGSSYRF